MKKHYLIGFDEYLNTPEREVYFRTHLTDEQTARSESYTVVSYDENDTLESVFACYDKDSDSKEVFVRDKTKYQNYPLNHIYHFIEDEQGKHSIGGEIPDNFTLPKSNKAFFYLGKISNQSEPLKWLPFDLHFPMTLLCDVQQVYLDYSNPKSPIIINIDEVNASGDFYDYSEELFAEYHEKRFRLDKATAFVADGKYDCALVNYAGIPEWVQNPFFPKCPKTGKYMRFVCQLASYQTKVSRIEGIDKKDCLYDELKELDFWGAGCLYLFFEPESKVACLFIQNT